MKDYDDDGVIAFFIFLLLFEYIDILAYQTENKKIRICEKLRK